MRVLRRMLAMCELSWEILTKALALSCVLLFCAFMLLLDAGTYSTETHDTYRLVSELTAAPCWILLIASVAGVCIEERQL